MARFIVSNHSEPGQIREIGIDKDYDKNDNDKKVSGEEITPEMVGNQSAWEKFIELGWIIEV